LDFHLQSFHIRFATSDGLTLPRRRSATIKMEGLLCLDRWRELFGAPSKIEEVWREYLNGPIVEEEANALRIRTWTGSVHNRRRGWVAPESTMSAGSSPAPMSG